MSQSVSQPHAPAHGQGQPQAQQATSLSPQDCATCVRRRIRCDRGLPTCAKCAKKALECPGYGRRLRWANGIAVRGHLKGMNAPVIGKTATAQPSPTSQTSPAHTSPAHTSPSQNSPLQTSPPQTSPFHTSPTSQVSPPSPTSSTSARSMRSPYADALEPAPERRWPGFPDAASRATLLAHYERNIAGLMVWIDSAQNEYRRLVLPLAGRAPGLLLAILAMSSQHLAWTTQTDHTFPARARDAAIGMISAQIRQVTGRLAEGHDLGDEIDVDTAIWMLASMLTLASYEMAGSEAGAVAADSHRQAARTLVNALATTHHPTTHPLFHFLRNQLSIYDILACTTSFGPLSTGDVILPGPADHHIFSEFLTVLHRVTVMSRRPSHELAAAAPLWEPVVAPATLRSWFGMARGATLMAAGLLGLPTDVRRRDFIRIVDIYHHAGLLYSYRCLYRGRVDPADAANSMAALLERLRQLEDRASCIQNLPWPVFVAGTECGGNQDQTRFVADLYRIIARDTGFRHYLEVLHFLSDLWSRPGQDWIDLARQYHSHGKQILAV